MAIGKSLQLARFGLAWISLCFSRKAESAALSQARGNTAEEDFAAGADRVC